MQEAKNVIQIENTKKFSSSFYNLYKYQTCNPTFGHAFLKVFNYTSVWWQWCREKSLLGTEKQTDEPEPLPNKIKNRANKTKKNMKKKKKKKKKKGSSERANEKNSGEKNKVWSHLSFSTKRKLIRRDCLENDVT